MTVFWLSLIIASPFALALRDPMVQPLHEKATSSHSEESADLENQIEQFLPTVLNRYFQVENDRAINLGGRILFLVRQQPAARAYIERHHTAAAERIQEFGQALQTGAEALNSGNAERAGALLYSVAPR